MSGSTIGGVVGAAIGFYFGGAAGAQIGWMVGSAVGGYVDPDVIEGPKLTDPQRQTSAEGVPRPIVYGTAAVMGNVIQCQSEPTQHSHEDSGKGGPVQKTYTYTRTCAIRICEAAPLDGDMKLRRAWVNGKLAYDATGTGSIDGDSAKFLSGMTFYSGNETQTPDADLEALPEADGGGVGNVPAYRGTCYVVLRNVDVTQGGGALPQFRWEVSSHATEASACTSIYGDAIAYWPLDDAARNGDARELIAGRNGKYSDTPGVAAAEPLRLGAIGSFNMTSREDCMIATFDGVFTTFNLTEWSTSAYCALNELEGTSGTVFKNVATYWQSAQFGYLDWSLGLSVDNQPFAQFSDGDTVGHNLVSTAPHKIAWIVSTFKRDPVDPTQFIWTLYVDGINVQQIITPNAPGRIGSFMTVGGGFYPNSYGFLGAVSDVAMWDKALEPDDIQNAYLTFDGHYPIPDLYQAIISESGLILNVCNNLVTPGSVVLSDVVADLIARAGVTDYDVATLTDTVRGFAITQPTDAAGAIRALEQVYFFDLPEWGDSGETQTNLRAVKRGGASVLTLSDDDLVDVEDDEDTRAQQVEFPRKVNFFYPNPDLNYEVSKQTAERVSENVKATNEANISTAVIFSADEAAQRADIAIRLAWEEAAGKSVVTVPEAFTGYVTSNILTRNGRRYRIDRIDAGDGTSRWELTRDRATAYVSGATAGVTVTPPTQTTGIRGPTVSAAMNLPAPLRTADTAPGIYVAGCGLTPAWAGYDLYISFDAGVSETFMLSCRDEATLGALDAACDSGATDLITARIFHNREISSVTTAQITAGANRLAIISSDIAEVVQARTATETATTGTYDLSNLTRAALSTAAAAHAAEDRIVLLDSAVKFVPIDQQYAGQTLILRFVSRGTLPASNEIVSLVFDPGETVIDGGVVSEHPPATGSGSDPTTGGTGVASVVTARTHGATVVDPVTYGASTSASAATNTAAFNSAYAALPGGGGIVRPSIGGTYLIDPTTSIKPLSNTQLDLATNDVTLQESYTATDHKYGLWIDGKTNVEIIGGHIIGYRDAWSAISGTTSEWGHCIFIGNSSSAISIKNCSISKAVGDAVSIGYTCSDVKIDQCVLTNCRRQGVSNGGDTVRVTNCEISYISGTSPQAGIDIEPDYPATSTGTVVDSCHIHHCTGPSVQMYKRGNSATITNNVLEYCNRGVYSIDSTGGIVQDNTIRYHRNGGVYLKGTSTGWTIGGASHTNAFYGNKTSTYGTPAAGGATTTVTGQSSATSKHLTIDSTASATVGANTFGPV